MRSRDLVMIVVSFLAMLAGSFLPGLAEPLAPFPRLCLIVLLYLGFLSVGTEALFTHTRLIPGTVSGLVLIRLSLCRSCPSSFSNCSCRSSRLVPSLSAPHPSVW